MPSSLNYNLFDDTLYTRTPTRLHYPARLRTRVNIWYSMSDLKKVMISWLVLDHGRLGIA